MSEPAQHHAINYIEFTTTDIAGTKAFYEKVFSWNFQDYGPDYISFDRDHAGIDGGFRKGEPQQGQSDTAPLVVLYFAGSESHAGCGHCRRRFHRGSIGGISPAESDSTFRMDREMCWRYGPSS